MVIEVFKTTKTGLEATDKILPGAWVNVVSPSDEEIESLKHIVHIPKEFLHSLQDQEELSKIEKEGSCCYITIRTPQKNVGGEIEYTTIPLGIIVSPGNIITVCYQKNFVVNEVKRNKMHINTADRIDASLQFMLMASKVYMSDLNNINKKAYQLQKDLEKSMRNREVLQLLNLEKSLVYFNTSIKSNQILTDKLSRHPNFTSSQAYVKKLEDVKLENAQGQEMTKTYSDILANTMDAFASIISNNLNQVMKTLTTLTLILAGPNLIFSFYGMNVEVPFMKSAYAVWIIIMLSLSIIATAGYISWKYDWF